MIEGDLELKKKKKIEGIVELINTTFNNKDPGG